MNFQNLKARISSLWLRFNLAWAEAGDIQRRLDEARAEHIRRYGIPWRF